MKIALEQSWPSDPIPPDSCLPAKLDMGWLAGTLV